MGERQRESGWLAWLLRWGPTLSAAVAVLLVGVRAGPPGLLVGLAGAASLLAARYRLSSPYVYAVGQVALVAALANGSVGSTRLPAVVGGSVRPVVWLAQGALLSVLVGPDLSSRRGRRIAVATLVATAVLGSIAAAAQTAWGRLWASVLALATTGGLIAYGLHRYEQVQLRVVERE